MAEPHTHAIVTRLAWTGWCVLSALLAAWCLAWGVWHLTREPALPAPPSRSSTASMPAAAMGARTVPIEAILGRNLMGLAMLSSATAAKGTAQEHAREGTAALEDMDAIPRSRRGWQLLGTVASSIALDSHAALLVDGVHRLTREGEVVQGWLVEKVTRKTVILHKDGIRERLVLDLPRKDAPATPPAGSTTPVPVPRGGATPLAQIAGDPAALLRDVAFRPKSLGSRQGLEITVLRAESPLHAHGLRMGDIVLEVNGTPLRGYDDLPGLLKALKAERLRITVDRLGKEVILE